MIRSKETRQYIIEKTATIFNKKGYTGTYLSDLTEATGLTKGSIYGNFKDKNEVALEAFRFNYSLQTVLLIPKMDKEPNAINKILIFFDHYKEGYKTVFQNGGCAILNTATDCDDGNEILRLEVVQTIEGWINRIDTILTEGIRKNEVLSINTKNLAHRIVAMIEGTILLSKTLNDPTILLKNIAYLEKEVKDLRKS